MSSFDKFDIDIAKLSLGQHELSYQIDNEFFELFDYSLVDKGNLQVDLELIKKTTFISLNYQIDGHIILTCDRSLDEFEYQLKSNNNVIIKYGEEAAQLSDEIELVPYNTQKINIAQHIYEFINVAVPMKKLHPRYRDESEDDQIIYSSSSKEDQEEEPQLDPRWSALKKLKKK